MNETDNLIEAQFNTLPEPLKKALNAVPWKSSVKEIALLNKLSFEQVATVERETMFILYGFESPDDYIANMMREAEIDEETATAIAESVNEKILKTIAAKVEESDKPGVAPANLPMVEPGEVAHTVPHAEQATNDQRLTTNNKPRVSVPDYRYDGKDPYREPLK